MGSRCLNVPVHGLRASAGGIRKALGLARCEFARLSDLHANPLKLIWYSLADLFGQLADIDADDYLAGVRGSPDSDADDTGHGKQLALMPSLHLTCDLHRVHLFAGSDRRRARPCAE